MRHPFAGLSPKLLGALTLRLAILTIFGTALIGFLDVPLRGGASPLGIVSFELAGRPTRALAILVEWRTNGALGHAKLIQIADFGYLLIYGAFFSMLALWVGHKLEEPVWSLRAAWAAILAAGFDVLENIVLLIEIVRFDSRAPYPQIALAFALAKFALIAGAILYGASGALLVLVRRYRRPL